MKQHKRVLALLLSFLMVFGLAACGAAQESAPASEAAAVSSEAVAEPEASASEAAPTEAPKAEAPKEEIPAEPPQEAPAEEAAKEAVESMAVKVGEGNMKTGSLALLNLDEEGRVKIAQVRQLVDWELVRQGYSKGGFQNISTGEVIYYDTLNTMLMALNAGQIDTADLYRSVAAYLCKENKDLVSGDYSWDDDQSAFARSVLKGVLTDDFSFLMMEDHKELRDEFDAVLNSMKLDGTLDKLAEEYIENPDTAAKAELPKFDDAETIRVGVTGDLPPLDYVAADGTPSGYNVAVLAEISNRTKKNIELMLIDSGARATALASGTVDVVFWALTSEYVKNLSEHGDDLETYMSAHTEEEKAIVAKIKEILTFDKATVDIPSGTIATVPYFSDFAVPVVTRAKANELGIAIPEEQVDPAQPTPTPTPIPAQNPPVVTKSPSSQTVEAGDSCYFVAKAENSIWSIWHFVSPDGLSDYKYADITDVFTGLKVVDGNDETMQLKNIPKDMNGWYVYCVFTNDYGSVASGSASISVSGGSSQRYDYESVVYPKSGSKRTIYMTSNGDWYDSDGTYYYDLGNGLYQNAITGTVYAVAPSYWYSDDYYRNRYDDRRDVVNETGYWVTIYYYEDDGWYDRDGEYYSNQGGGLFLNTTTNMLYASSESYWYSSDYYNNYSGKEVDVVSEYGTWISIFETANGWYDHNGIYYWTSGDGVWQNTYTGTLYAKDADYWNRPSGEGSGSFPVYTEDGQTIYIWYDSATGNYADQDGAIYYDNGDQTYTSAGSGRILAEYMEYWNTHSQMPGGRTDENATNGNFAIYNEDGDVLYIGEGGGAFYTDDGQEFHRGDGEGTFVNEDTGELWSTDPDYWD